MKSVSDEYISSMAKQTRNRGYIECSIGLVNLEAQDDISITSDVCYISQDDMPKNSLSDTYKIYATSELNFSKVDCSMYFPPLTTSTNIYDNGVVTESVGAGSSITISFADTHTISGLTIYFGETYPTSVTIETDNDSYTCILGAATLTINNEFTNISYIKITANEMQDYYEYTRLRIYAIRLGKDLYLTNDDITNYTEKNTISWIASEVPSKDVTIEVSNIEDKYNFDDDSSDLKYIQQYQTLKTRFGYDVDGNGSIEWLPWQTTYIDKYSTSSSALKITTTDRLNFMNDKYEDNSVYNYSVSRTLYELGSLVAADAGLEKDEYSLEFSTLNSYSTSLVTGSVTHKEALQMIANAGRCMFMLRDDGGFDIKQNLSPTEYELDYDAVFDMSVSVDNNYKKLNVAGTKYEISSDAKEESVYSGAVTITAGLAGNGEDVTMDCCCKVSHIEAKCDNSSYTVTYAAFVQTSGIKCAVSVGFDYNVTEDVKVTYTLYGYKYTSSTEDTVYTINGDGNSDVTLTNPIVDVDKVTDTSLTPIYGDWIYEDYKNMYTYTLDWRGDPALDIYDLIVLKKDDSEIKIRPETMELSFSGAWSGKITGRKVIEA